MAPDGKRSKHAKKVFVRELNPYLTCSLCGGYFIDATALVDCLHVFCRGCILRYFESSKVGCPTCQTVYKKKNHPCFRPDPTIQALVYKMVPGLYAKEMQRREDFYRSTNNRASSSCSDDSVLGEQMQDHEEWVTGTVSENSSQYFSPDDLISLSLEYYQAHLDTSQEKQHQEKHHQENSSQITFNSTNDSTKKSDQTGDNYNNNNNNNKLVVTISSNNSANNKAVTKFSESDFTKDHLGGGGGIISDISSVNSDVSGKPISNNSDKSSDKSSCNPEVSEQRFASRPTGDRRYLQCPAAVNMSLLQKFIRMKYALSPEHKVDIIYEGEVLPHYFSLMDVAYTFKWQRVSPMRFFYRIFTPMKIRPIKIINTASNTGEKQLQIVPVKSEPKLPAIDSSETLNKMELEAQNYRNKERLMAELQLQSKAKMLEHIEKEKAKHIEKEKAKHIEKEKAKHIEKEKAKHIEKEKSKHIEKEKSKHNEKEKSKHAEKEKAKQLEKEKVKQTEKERTKQADKEREREQRERSSNKNSDSTSSKTEKRKRISPEPCYSISKRKHSPEPHCVYEYEEPDKEEIKRFAEKRDREWALQKKIDELEQHRVSRKRKKNKHSKGEMHKKRKLHAEITSSEANQEESLKLKLKVTNGHKHKHHKIVESTPVKTYELSNKEKLLQMRQVRHKNNPQQESSEKTVKSVGQNTDNIEKKAMMEKTNDIGTNTPPVKKEVKFDLKEKSEESVKVVEKSAQTVKSDQPQPQKGEINKLHIRLKSPNGSEATIAKSDGSQAKPLRTDFPLKAKDLCYKNATVQIERNEQTERQAQTTFLKTFQSYTQEKALEKLQAQAKAEKIISEKKQQLANQNYKNALERKIANLQQQCTIEARKTPTPPAQNKNLQEPQQETKETRKIPLETVYSKKPIAEKQQILNSHQYPSGFTVSKIESGVKRKIESEEKQEKRPSLEITLIPPAGPATNVVATPKSSPNDGKPKRPPPATIPLDRIKNKLGLKTGISIIPKLPEKCDNIGALDLSKPSRVSDPKTNQGEFKNTNGFNGNGICKDSNSTKAAQLNNTVNKITERVLGTQDKNVQLSNLQMLSKVASEHHTLNKPQGGQIIKPQSAHAVKPQTSQVMKPQSGQIIKPQSVQSLNKVQSTQSLNKPLPKPHILNQNLAQNTAKIRPQIPSLKIPLTQSVPNLKPAPKLTAMPKLNEIKPGFRLLNPQIRNMRPNQNQNIRNIPNPSLIVRQQNQNRLNSLTTNGPNVSEVKEQSVKVTNNNAQTVLNAEKPNVDKQVMLETLAEKADVTVGKTA